MATIPNFPAFRRLDLSDRPVIDAITQRFPPYSDFSFTSLWAWDTDETCTLSLLHGNLVVRLKEYAADDHFFSFLGCNMVADTARTLLQHSLDLGMPATLRLVPEATVVADDRLQRWLSVDDDPDNADYVCSVADWAALAGGAFRNHRYAAARCRRDLSPAFERLDLGDSAIQAMIVDLFHRWEDRSYASKSRDCRHEFAALQRLLALPAGHRPWACGLLCGDRLVGFSISEGIVGSPYAIAHFRKIDREIEGVGALLHHHESCLLLRQGYQYLNVEQDLGIPGLRKFKLLLRPREFLRKYVISPKRADPNTGWDPTSH